MDITFVLKREDVVCYFGFAESGDIFRFNANPEKWRVVDDAVRRIIANMKESANG